MQSEKNKNLDHLVANPTGTGPSFTFKNRVIRALWNVVWFFGACWTPPAMHSWRRMLLILFGAKMASCSDVRGSAKVWYPALLEMGHGALIAERVRCYNQAKIIMGEFSLVSQGAYLCAGSHNVDDAKFQLLAKPIYIGSGCWIAADAFVGPGVTINDRAVLGARGVAFSNLERNMVYVGNPAKSIRARQGF